MEKIPVSAIIPAYNEESAVIQTVDGLREILKERAAEFEIIVVNDGSTDLTGKALEERKDITVLNHPTNKGYGRSLISGIEKAKHEWILIIDADGSYPPEEAEKLFDFAPQFDMVIGARQGRLFWGKGSRAAMRWIYLSLARFVAGEKIPDANSGLRLFRKKDALDMPILCFGYSFTTTMTLSLMQSGKFVKFVPVHFTERIGKSKVKALRDILRTLQIMTQVIIYYNPLKFFATKAILNFLLFGIIAAVFRNWILLLTAFYASVFIFFFGLVIESLRVNRRFP